MQNFPHSPAPPSLPPGFSGRGGGGGGPPYAPQPTDPQISPRMTEDYTGMQQQQAPLNPQSHSQHPHHRGHHLPSQASSMLAYSGGRNRGSGEPPQGSVHSANSNNPYRKEAMDYYFSMGGKDRHRRGGMGYGSGFGYSNLDGHIPPQYRHVGSGSASSSGMMSPYPVDYGPSVTPGSGAAGAFSPSHQYAMSQNPAMQVVAGSQMQPRHHGQNYPGHQGSVHHGQQQRSYPHPAVSGGRMAPQYSHYPPQGGTTTGSSGIYSPPPQRYHEQGPSSTGFDPKVNSPANSNSNSVSGAAAANNVGPLESHPQGFHPSAYPSYSPQAHSLHKQATLQHRNSQHSVGLGYDKMQHHGPSPGSVYGKPHPATHPSIPHPASSQEIAKSPMHSNAQQTQLNQNFSPISNPSPAASVVQSPNCSSSPSPLMGVPEGHGNSSAHAPSHPPPPPVPNPRSSHGRLLQTVPQLSPTPNSNSSVSSCGSSGSHKPQGLNAGVHSSLSGRSRMGMGGVREEGCAVVYPASPLDKLQDSGLNSLNALTSQVANLPNTVQHMLLTDTVLTPKRARDGGPGPSQPGSNVMPPSQPRSRNASAASSTSTVREGGGAVGGDCASSEAGVDEDSSVMSPRGFPGAKLERDEHFSEGEHRRMRQMSGASSGSEPTSYYPQNHGGQGSHGRAMSLEVVTKQAAGVSEVKAAHGHVPSSSSPSIAAKCAQGGPTSRSRPPVTSTPSASSAPPFRSNCLTEPVPVDADGKYGPRKTVEGKNEGTKGEYEGVVERREKSAGQGKGGREVSLQHGQDKENRLEGKPSLHSDKRGMKTKDSESQSLEEQHNASGVGVIVSARSEGSQADKPGHPEENCLDEKHPHAFFRDSGSQNGEEGVDLSVYSSHHQLHQKPHFGRPQNPPCSGPQKYGYPESPSGSDVTGKNRGRPGPGGSTESNLRFPVYHQSQPNYGPAHSKDVVEVAGKRGEGQGARGHDDHNAQLQQPFPSLLQEVLQGYNSDRRYGRPEQALTAHLQAQMTQQQFPGRQAYGAADGGRVQAGASEPVQMTSSAKPPQSNRQRQGAGHSLDVSAEPHPPARPEAGGAKTSHHHHADKIKAGVPRGHLPDLTDSRPPPTKHINLADYSLPQRKPPPGGLAPSSAVQELLLQEAEPLLGGPGHPEVPKPSAGLLAPSSSERRSVICDVSPGRRGTPERDRESDRDKGDKSQTVIQPPFTSPTAAAGPGNPGREVVPCDKREVKMEVGSKETVPEPVHLHADLRNPKEAHMEYHGKPTHASVLTNADPYKRSSGEMAAMTPHPSANPLSSPSRHTAYIHGVDLSGAHQAGYPAYRYGDARDGSMMQRNPHYPSHHPYHALSPPAQLQNPQSGKLQMYPYARGPHHPLDVSDRLDWGAPVNRPAKDMMMQPGPSPGIHKLSQSEQRQRMMLSHGELMPSDPHLAKAPHPGSYYDMKMWESAHSGREMMEGDPYHRAQHPNPPPLPSSSLPPAAAHHRPALPTQVVPPVGPSATEAPDLSRGPAEDTKPLVGRPPLGFPSNSTKTPRDGSSPMPPAGQRQSKGGLTGDTNPLMLRRRVRSFISPIPAKRLHQDGGLQRAALNSHHSPGALSESSHHNDQDDSSSSDMTCPRLASPTPGGQNAYSQSLSPSGGGKGKLLSPRKGRGLKLEAIVQKITPSGKKPSGHGDVDSNHYPSFSHSEMSQFSDSMDQDLAHFSRVGAGDEGYMEDGHSLNSLMPFRGLDETGPLPPSAYACDPHHASSHALKQQADFDFGLGPAGALAVGDKEDLRMAADFSLLGPLPPPPPLPRPVQGSPPPSSSALSDIQHFTNTYQQLETRRGDQSTATLLRQKLQESGMGFDDYSAADYYGGTPPQHGQGHMLSRHPMTPGRSSLSPQQDSGVPKGYFPSGKKKGRPVGSVNKQKRSQGQGPPGSHTPTAVPHGGTSDLSSTSPGAAVTPPLAPLLAPLAPPCPTAPPLAVSPLSNHQAAPCLTPPTLTQVVKLDTESEDMLPEAEVKPRQRRRAGVKDEVEGEGGEEVVAAAATAAATAAAAMRGRQRRRRRSRAAVGSAVAAPEEDLDAPSGPSPSSSGVLPEARKGVFTPHIHVENKVPEIGAVCTIVNAEEEKATKGERAAAAGGKGGGGGGSGVGLEALLASAARRERDAERREAEEAESALLSRKALPSSGYVVTGPVITETSHSGRLLCCLCQKWANYKHLGDLYGPYYPAEYAARLPKNQPQVRLGQAATATKAGPNSESGFNASASQETYHQQQAVPLTNNYQQLPYEGDHAVGHFTKCPSSMIGTEMMMYLAGKLANSAASRPPAVSWDMSQDYRPIPELKKEPEPLSEIPYPPPYQQPQQQQIQQPPPPQQQHQQQQQQPPPPPPQPAPEESPQRPPHRKLTSHPRFKRRHKSSDESPRMVPSNNKASLPFQPPPPALDSLGPLAQLAQLPQMPMDPEELWVHEGCMVWSSGVFLVNGKLYGLQEALDGARDTCCSYCEMVGSTLGCYTKGCTLRYHFLCASEADCTLNEENFSLRCPKHKVKRESFPRAVGQPSPCTWSSLREAEGDSEEDETQGFGIGKLEGQETEDCW